MYTILGPKLVPYMHFAKHLTMSSIVEQRAVTAESSVTRDRSGNTFPNLRNQATHGFLFLFFPPYTNSGDKITGNGGS